MSDLQQRAVLKEMAGMAKEWFNTYKAVLLFLVGCMLALTLWVAAGYYFGPYLNRLLGLEFESQLGTTALGMDSIAALAFLAFILLRWYLAARARVSDSE
jgi:hypothetical protein